MALSPSIPTSFVPKQTGPVRRPSASNNIFLLISIVIFVLTLIAAGGVFFYAQFLKSTEDAEAQQLLDAKKTVDTDQVEQFIRLKNRLLVAEDLMNKHVELSQFFDELEKVTLANVRFSSLIIQVADDRSATINMVGQARTFNALAAESKVFASEPNIKSAIFSNINPNSSDKTVTFSVTATLDPKLVVQVAPPAAISTPVQTTSATSSIQKNALPSVTTSVTSSTSTGL